MGVRPEAADQGRIASLPGLELRSANLLVGASSGVDCADGGESGDQADQQGTGDGDLVHDWREPHRGSGGRGVELRHTDRASVEHDRLEAVVGTPDSAPGTSASPRGRRVGTRQNPNDRWRCLYDMKTLIALIAGLAAMSAAVADGHVVQVLTSIALDAADP